MSYQTFEVCDGCGRKQEMPPSWTPETNPLKGWVNINLDAGSGARASFCPSCITAGKATAFLEVQT